MLLERHRAQLLIVDMQERLAPHIHEGDQAVHNAGILLQAAERLEIPVTVSEQYVKGLGPTVAPLQPGIAAATIFEKVHFSCAADAQIRRHLRQLEQEQGRDQIVICGMEAHICVLQTALGLVHAGHRVAVVLDAVGSRNPRSRDIAMARMLKNDIETVTTEMVLFEWMAQAATDEFRALSKLIK